MEIRPVVHMVAVRDLMRHRRPPHALGREDKPPAVTERAGLRETPQTRHRSAHAAPADRNAGFRSPTTRPPVKNHKSGHTEYKRVVQGKVLIIMVTISGRRL